MPNCKMFGLTNTKCNEHSSCMQVGHNRTQQRVYDGETQWATGRWSVDAAAGEARAPRAVRPAARLMNEPTRVLLHVLHWKRTSVEHTLTLLLQAYYVSRR